MRVLNLVYDNWPSDSDLPKANCVNIYGEDTFWDAHHLIMHYLNETLGYGGMKEFIDDHEKFELKRCRLNEVDERPNENFYYFINHFKFDLRRIFRGQYDHNEINAGIAQGKKPLSDEIIKMVREKDNFFIGFMTEHECDSELGYMLLVEYLNNNSIPLEKVYVINNNAKLYRLKILHGDNRLQEHSLEFIPNSSTAVLQKIGSEFKPVKEGKFFMCHNKSPKQHRYATLCVLKRYGILDDVNWSLIPSYDGYPVDFFYDDLFDEYMREMMDSEIQYFRNIDMKTSDYEGDEGWFKPYSDIDKSMFPVWQQIPEKKKTFEESYVNIVTESHYVNDQNVVQVTEKSFRPFFFYQLPIIVATPHHIGTMKSRYHLDFFEDIINHNYDDKMGNKERFFDTMREIKRLHKNKDRIKEFYVKNYDRLEANKQRVLDILKIKRDYMFFSNLVVKNR